MLKEELRRSWGQYCDTDKLVDSVMALLTKYHHKNSERGVCKMLNVYFTNKESLIRMFMRSDKYIGNMRICLDVELERRNNASEIISFCDSFAHVVDAQSAILKYVDEFGKGFDDYTATGVSRFKAKDLHYGNIMVLLNNARTERDKFNSDGATKESHNQLRKFKRAISEIKYNARPILSGDVAIILEGYVNNARFSSGMKTSRAFNRLCAAYGVDKLPNYNKLFAQYADMVSGLKRKAKFYISLNPLDYLTMSFGNSWSSCHTIDRNNERGMPNSYRGMHCGGTVSYMLDRTSIITYVHDHATEDHEEGKIYRNMFHYENDLLIQGRVYPQGNDGATDLYSEFRSIMQGEMSKILGVTNDWIKRTCGCGENTCSTGAHYADYINFDGCNTSYPREMSASKDNVVHIGHNRICPYCGDDVDYDDEDADTGMLTHYDCWNQNF